ncbi:unnamed protein product [Lymnaea stagnalis]|uniref:Uncharacterized protein n=1 Tax=Lymnaea stagnalis TaxID=6523 RepID=A0AAV2H4E8_LYMST
MENIIVKDFENLKVFAQRNFIMDELVQDLTTALEETANVGRPGTSQAEGANSSTYPRRYVKKRRGLRRPAANNYYWKRGTISEASESSVDEHPIRDYAGNVIHSDSDDLAACQRIPKLTVPLVDPVPPVESDSFTENLSPLRPQRRRRKFKTMAVDSSPLTDHIPSDADSASGDKQLGRRKEESPAGGVDKPNYSGLKGSIPGSYASHSHAVTAGKRKRSSKSRTDYNFCPNRDFPSHGVSSNMDRMEIASISQESSLSSSEFDSDLNANNEDTREADDEQSDFFHEPGPACGIPDIVPWWENERVTDEPLRIDSDFEKILTGTFAHLPKFSNQSFKARVGKLMSGTGREIRLGRRKLKGKMPRYTVGRFLQDREHWNRMQSHHPSPLVTGALGVCSNNSNCHGVEFKRRRHVTRSAASVEGISGQCSDPVPENSVTSKVLRPIGTGAMKSPVAAVRRSTRKSGAGYINVSDS